MKLEIKAPCPENWDGMTPDAAGRYCPACAKSVHDFTGKPKEALLAFLLWSTQSPCVRMLASQQHFTAGEVEETAQKLIRSGKSIPAAALALVMLFATGCGIAEKADLLQNPDKVFRKTDCAWVEPPPKDTSDAVPAKTANPASLPEIKTPDAPVLLGEPVMMGAPPMVAPPDTTDREIMGDVAMPPAE